MRQEKFSTYLPGANKCGAPYVSVLYRTVAVLATACLVQGCSTNTQRLSGSSLSAYDRQSFARQRPAPIRYASAARPPRAGGHYKIGKPYDLRGVRYVPRHEPNYDRTGIASWYGGKFHGRLDCQRRDL